MAGSDYAKTRANGDKDFYILNRQDDPLDPFFCYCRDITEVREVQSLLRFDKAKTRSIRENLALCDKIPLGKDIIAKFNQ